jgi:hypothetical protein
MFMASRRERTGNERFFAIRVVIFSLGAALGIAGMLSEIDWLVWIAIGVLVIGIVLRMVGSRRAEQ